MREDVIKKDGYKKRVSDIDKIAKVFIRAKIPVMIIVEYIFLMWRYVREIGQYRESYNPLSPFTDMFGNDYYPTSRKVVTVVIMLAILYALSFIYPKIFFLLSMFRCRARNKFISLTSKISADDFDSEKEKFMAEYNGYITEHGFSKEDYPAFLYEVNKFKKSGNFDRYREANLSLFNR